MRFAFAGEHAGTLSARAKHMVLLLLCAAPLYVAFSFLSTE
jgi:hypothetical protein